MESLSDHEIAHLGFKAVQEGDADKLASLTEAHRSPFPLEWRSSMATLRSLWVGGLTKSEHLMSDVAKMNIEAVLEHRSDYDFLLTTAIYSRNLEVVERLLEAGAAVNGIDFRGWSPLGNAVKAYNSLSLGYAVKQKILDIAEFLLKRGANPNVANTRNGVPLVVAVSGNNNNESLIKLLLSYGADINKPDESGDNLCSPLCKGISKRYWGIVGLLLGYKPCIDSGEISKVIGFKLLAEYDKMVSIFKEHTLTFDVLNRADGNKLFDAIREGNVEVVEESLKRNDQLVRSVDKAITPLHVAVFYKQEKVVELLIGYGADLLSEDGYGKTPVDYATENSDGSMLMTFFTIKPCFRDSLLFSAAKIGSLGLLDRLLRAGANVFAQDDRGYTPLHRAVYHDYSDAESLKVLLNYGADPNILDKNGLNALCSACHDGFDYRFVYVLEVLFNYGVDVNTVLDDHGYTPFTNTTCGFDVSDYDETSYYVDCLHRLAKWRAAGLRVSDRNFNLWKEFQLDDDSGTQEFLSRCEREVMLMKQERVNPLLRLYDVLTASEGQLAKLAGDEKFTKSVLSGRYSNRYPLYNDLITAKFQLGKIRRRFLEKGRETLQFIWPDLPILVREGILQFLSNKDVFLLARSTCTDKPHDDSCCCRRPVRP